MRGVVAILGFDGAPVDPVEFAAMKAAGPAYPGPYSATWRGEGAALAVRTFASPSSRTPGPIHDIHRQLAFVFDGRLDNRAELHAALGTPADLPDARLAFEAAVAWDSGAPRRMLGDYAFVLWDLAHRRAVIARDHLGIRTMYFHADARRLVCAGELAQVMAARGVPREPDLTAVALHLASAYPNDSSTLFRGVHRLPPAHTAVIDAGGVRLSRFWDATPSRAIRHPSDAEYAEHCRELLLRGTHARMRDAGPIAVTLSGGVDSSAVTVAAHIADPGVAVQPFSLTFPVNAECEEREYFTAVAARCDATVIECPQEPIAGDTINGWVRRSLDVPASPSDAMAEPMWRAMHARGYRVALTGVGGDSVFSGTLFHYADLIRDGRLGELVRRYRADVLADTGTGGTALLQAGIWPALPPFMKATLRPAARRVLKLLQPGGARRWLRLDVPTVEQAFEPRGGSFATEGIARVIEGAANSRLQELGNRVAGESGVEMRHPLLDVRLVEFAVAIPEEQRKRGPLLKYVLRHAVPELPVSVATRVSKAAFDYAAPEALDALGGEALFSHLAIAECGWVDGEALKMAYRRMREAVERGDGDLHSTLVPALWDVASVELWYRHAFGNRPDGGV